MNTAATQINRIAELTTPLGTDMLLLTGFHMAEELGRPFEINISCFSEEELVDFNAALGKHCVIRFITTGQKKRYFSGRLVEARWKGKHSRGYDYDIVLRPWFWLLKHSSDSRIFQRMSVPDIIKKVFGDAGFSDFRLDLRESYPTIEYCVQYRESHFDFVSRLMEQYGIFYYFKHSDSKHEMVLADGKGSLQPVPDLPSCEFLGRVEHTREDGEYLYEWASGRAFRTGKILVNAFDFDKPNASLKHTETSAGGYTHDQLQHTVYPHKYKQGQESDLGKKYAQAWLFAAQSEDKRRIATGDAASLFPGGLVKVEKHPQGSENIEYLVVAANHTFTNEMFSSGGGAAESESYNGEYLLQPSDRPFKAAQITPSPIIAGPQTAMVVGPKGEEIHTDKHGRVRVQFHWDREGKKDENSSRWVRVAQIWGGKAWGGIVIPRIGMEVVVEFIEGDPDRPIIVGCVYNGENTPPFALPENKTISGVKSRSTKGGSDSNYNEFVFEDKKGAEYVRLHAEKDLNATIEDKETRIIEGKGRMAPFGEASRETTIKKGDDNITVQTGDQNIKIGNSQDSKINMNRSTKVGMMDKVDIGMARDMKIGMDSKESVGIARNVTIGVMDSLKVGAVQSITVGGMLNISASIITLSAGGSTVIISPVGVVINGPLNAILQATAVKNFVGTGVLVPPPPAP